MTDGEHDSRSASADLPAASTPPPVEPDPLIPVHAVVFTAVAILAVGLGLHGADAYHAARSAGSFPADVRRLLAFTLLFNFAVLVALALAVVGEGLRTIVRLVRRGRPGRLLARCGFSLVPVLVFGLGHAWLNPWLPDLLREVRTLVASP